jgi:ATP-dependent helicase HrpA
MLVIASALSVQDVRERPMEAQAQADQAHAKFDDEKSEFVSWLKLWQWLETSRTGKPPTVSKGKAGGVPLIKPLKAPLAAATKPADTLNPPQSEHKLSHRQQD